MFHHLERCYQRVVLECSPENTELYCIIVAEVDASVSAFIAFFGWGGVFWGSYGWSGFAIALACGITMMAITTFIIYSMLKMQQTGNVKATDLIGQNGIVYLTIPGERKSSGLVTVSLPNCTRQISAIADMEIPTGAAVVVEELFGNGIFLVKPVTL